MKDLDKRDEFDDQWKGAFEDAEWQPDENVWMNINNHLVEKENSFFRRKAVIFKWIAAASLLVAVSVGLISLLGQSEESSIAISEQNNSVVDSSDGIKKSEPDFPVQTKDQGNLAISKEKNSNSGMAENSTGKSTNENIETGAGQSNTPSSDRESQALLADGNNGGGNQIAGENQNNGQKEGGFLPGTNEDETQQETFSNDPPTRGEGTLIALNVNAPDALSPLTEFNLTTTKIEDKPVLYKVPEEWRLNEQKESSEKPMDQLWAGVNFSSGLFDPNFQSSNFAESANLAPAFSSNTLDAETFMRNNASSNRIEEDSRAGVSYAAGINFGMNVSKKVVLQSGILYAVNNSSSTTNLVVDDFGSNDAIPVHVSNYSMQAMRISSRQETAPVDIENQFEFVSVPMKAGYVLFGDRLQLILSGGVSADFFMNNTLSGETSGYQSISMQSGSDSPFRTVSFNGLLGTELTYKILDNYLIMIEPSYRFSVTNFAKDNYYYNSFPQSFNVGFGFKYMLR